MTAGLMLGPTLDSPAEAGYQDDGLLLTLESGPNAGLAIPADEQYWTIPVWSQPGGTVQGPAVYGGYGCASDRPTLPSPAAAGPLEPGDRAIIVLQRGPTGTPCGIAEKVESAMLAGFDAVILANSEGTDAPYCASPERKFTLNVTAMCVGHPGLHLLFGTADAEPALGDLGQRVRAQSLGMPVTYSRNVLGPGWVAFAVRSPGGLVKVPLRLDVEEAPGQLNGFLYDENDAFLGGVGFGVFRSEISYFGTVKGPISLSAGEVVQRERSGMMSMIVEVSSDGPQTFKLLVWGGGRKLASFQAALRGEGIEVLGIETGTGAVLATAAQFDAPVNVDAHANAGGRATITGEKIVTVQDTLVGSFGQMSMSLANQPPWTGVDANYLAVTTPTSQSLCNPISCNFNAMTGTSRNGPGTYSFTMSGGGAGMAGSDDVLLNVVDARLPAIQAEPPPDVPEVPWAPLVPLTGVMALAASLHVRRRGSVR
ncbi:MAG: hypothetical protein JJD92_15880 [Frankiaceae bacterium]|nr:hypothetical protein [Frankiaceae bacterium]